MQNFGKMSFTMANINRLKDDIQVLSNLEKKVFEKVCSHLIREGWDPIVEYDIDWGCIVLASQDVSEFGIVLRRIKPFALNSLSDFDRALKVQTRLRLQLVEVLPYKVFLGNKISLAATDKPFTFLSVHDFHNWTKFFKSKKISLKTTSIDEPIKKMVNQQIIPFSSMRINNFDLKGGDDNAK